MRAALPLAILSFAALALAGCLGQTTGGTDTSPPPTGPTGPPGINVTRVNDTPPAPAGPVVKSFTGHASGVALPGVAALANPTIQDNNGNFVVPAAALGIVVEVVWNGSDALNVYAYPPCDDPGADPLGATANCPAPLSNEQGHSPAKILLDDLSKLKNNGAGNWTIVVYAQQNPTGVAFTAFSSVFSTEKPTDSYTAVKA